MAADDKAPSPPAGRRGAQRHQAGPAPDGQPPADLAPDAADRRAHSTPPGVAWLVADEPLYIGHPDAAAAPVRAYNPGDLVAADQVDRYGWHDRTHVPEWATAPPAPAPEPSSSEEHT